MTGRERLPPRDGSRAPDDLPEREEYDFHAVKHVPRHPSRTPGPAGRWITGLLALTVLGFGGLAAHEYVQQKAERVQSAEALTHGRAARGRILLRSFGCARCHTIHGVPDADGLVGPPLSGIARRMYVAGVLLNTPDNIVRWIMDPKAVDSLTAMPALGVSEAQARDIAAYLYTLR